MGYRIALLFFALRSFALAQAFLPAFEPAMGRVSLPPKNPTISAVTPLWQGVLQQGMADPSGPVAEARQEDVIPEGAAPYPARRTTILKFDGAGHLFERTYQDSLGTTTTTSVFQDGKLQSRTTKHHRTDGRFSVWQEWYRWSYDPKGRVADFRAGSRKDEEHNHYLNLKYDLAGRLLGYEYRQNGSDEPFSFTEFQYDGNTIISDEFDQHHQKIFEQVQVLDGSNRVIELSVSDMNNGALKLWYHSKFKYDEQGRLTEQNTDQYNYGPGDVDSEPPPGKVVIQYDDKKHTGEQDFYNPDGRLVLRMLAELDSHGYVTKTQVLDATGKESKASEGIWVDPKTHTTHSGRYVLEATYDDHGNWTELRSWFAPADGGGRILTRSIKQTITYR